MAQSADEGIDFQLISVPHQCHKADKYLSRVTTFASRPWAQTRLFFCVLSANGARLLWFFLYGVSFFLFFFVLFFSPHLKTLHDFFMPFFKIAILALNPISLFKFVDSLMISGYLCLVCNVSCSPLPGTYDQAYRLINRYNNNNYLMELDQIMHRRRLWAKN